jgi:hypothetical protein
VSNQPSELIRSSEDQLQNWPQAISDKFAYFSGTTKPLEDFAHRCPSAITQIVSSYRCTWISSRFLGRTSPQYPFPHKVMSGKGYRKDVVSWPGPHIARGRCCAHLSILSETIRGRLVRSTDLRFVSIPTAPLRNARLLNLTVVRNLARPR